MSILERFLKYISIDTSSDSSKSETPSTRGQFTLANLLVKELNQLNLDVHFDEDHCYVYGCLKGNQDLLKIGFISHLDTSENAPGKDINPEIIKNYDGEDVTLKNQLVLSNKTYTDLKNHIGKTLLVTDGTTLLGADDKSGIAEIMTMLENLQNTSEEHGDIYVCFTPDEEIGLGTLHFDKDYFNPNIAYTVDGSNVGEFSYENFNAATATINIEGVSTHCGSAKGKMINAGRIATLINSSLPDEIPENTENYEGFYHLEEIKGNTSSAFMKYLIRDFDKENFENRKNTLSQIVEGLNGQYNDCIDLNIKDTYKNMYEVVSQEKSLINKTKDIISELGVTPDISPIRGGTDGTSISFMGIPCPNLGTGGHNFHSVYEYICLEDMEKTSDILTSIAINMSKLNTQDALNNEEFDTLEAIDCEEDFSL